MKYDELRVMLKESGKGYDMDMIEKAGLSLAMSNATEVLKSAADRTICSYQEHSAAYILLKITFFYRRY